MPDATPPPRPPPHTHTHTNLIISVITAAMQGVLWQTLGGLGLGQPSGVSLGGSVVRGV